MLKMRSGAPILAQFRDHISSQRVKIIDYPSDLKAQLRSVHPIPSVHPVLGADFITDGSQGTIYLNTSAPLGLTLPLLFHEMVHSTDESLWRLARSKANKHEIRSIILHAEYRAFQAQHLLIQELKALHPNYLRCWEQWKEQVPFLFREITRDEIDHLYGAIPL